MPQRRAGIQLHYGRAPSVPFFTPTTSGVTTGAPAPTNSITAVPALPVVVSVFATQTFPAPSTAIALEFFPLLALYPVAGEIAAPAFDNSDTIPLESARHAVPAP